MSTDGSGDGGPSEKGRADGGPVSRGRGAGGAGNGGAGNGGGEDSLWFRLLSAFLDERTIRWLLGIGIALVLAGVGSLVAKNWEFFETNTGLQYLLLLVVTGGLSAAGHVMRVHVGLPRTAFAFDLLALLTVPLDLAALPALGLLRMPHSAGGWMSAALVVASLPALGGATARALRVMVGGAPRGFVGALVGTAAGVAAVTAWGLLGGAVGQVAVVVAAAVALAAGLAAGHEALVIDRGNASAAPLLLGTVLWTFGLGIALRAPGWSVVGLAIVLAGWMAVHSAAAMATVRPPRTNADAPAVTGLLGFLATLVGISLAFGGEWLGNGVLGVALAAGLALFASSWLVLRRPAFLHLAVGALVLEVMLAGWIHRGLHETLASVFARVLGEGTHFAAVPLVLVVVILERAMLLARPGTERGQLGAMATLMSLVSIGLAMPDPRGRVVMLGLFAVLHGLGALLHLEKDLLVVAGLELAAAAFAFARPGTPAALDVAAGTAVLAPVLLGIALWLRGSTMARMTSYIGFDRVLPVHPLTVAALVLIAGGGVAALNGIDSGARISAALPLVVSGTTLLVLWRHHRRRVGEEAPAPGWLNALGIGGLVWHAAASALLALPLLGLSAGQSAALPVRDLVGLALLGAALLRGRWALDRAGGRPRIELSGTRFDPLSASGHLYLVLALALAIRDGAAAGRFAAPLVLLAYLPELFVRDATRPALYPVLIALEATVLLWLPAELRATAARIAGGALLALALGAERWMRERYPAWPDARAAGTLPPLELALLHLPLALLGRPEPDPVFMIPWAVIALLAAATEYASVLPLYAAELLGLVASATVLRTTSGVLADGARMLVMGAFLLYPSLARWRKGDADPEVDTRGTTAIAGHLCGALQVVAALGLGRDGAWLAAMLAGVYAALCAASWKGGRHREAGASGLQLLEPALLFVAAFEALTLAAGLLACAEPLRAAAVAGASALVLAAGAPLAMRAIAGDGAAWPFPLFTDVALVNAAFALAMVGANWPPELRHYSLGSECGRLALALGLAGAAQLVALRARTVGWLAWTGVFTTAAAAGMAGKWISTGGPPGMFIGAGAALMLAVAAPRLAALETWSLTSIPVLVVSCGAALSSVARMIKLAGPNAPAEHLNHLVQRPDQIFMITGYWSTPMGIGLALLAATAVAWELAGLSAAGWLAVPAVLCGFHGGALVHLPGIAQPAALAALCVGASLAGRWLRGEGAAREIVTSVAHRAGDLGRIAVTALFVAHLGLYWLPGLTGPHAELALAAAFAVLCAGDLLTLRQAPGYASGVLGVAAASGLVWCGTFAVMGTPEDAALALAWVATAMALATRFLPAGEPPAWADGWLPPVRILSGVATSAALGTTGLALWYRLGLGPSGGLSIRLVLAGCVPLALAWVRSSFLRECLGLGAITLAIVELAAKWTGGHIALLTSAWLPATLLIVYFTYRGIGHALEGAPDWVPVPPRSWLAAGRAAAALGGPAVVLALVGFPFPDDVRGLGRTLALLAMELAFLRSRRRTRLGNSWLSQSVPVLELALFLIQLDRLVFWNTDVHPPHFWPVLAAVLGAVGWLLDALARVERPVLVRETVAPEVLLDWARVYRVTATAALLPCLAGAIHPGLAITIDLAATALLLPLLGRGLPAVWPLATLAVVLLVPVHALLSGLDAVGLAPGGDRLPAFAPWLAAYLALAAEALTHAWERSRWRAAAALWLAPERIAPLAAAARDVAVLVALAPFYGLLDSSVAGPFAMASGAVLLATLAVRTGSMVTGALAVLATALSAHSAVWNALAAHHATLLMFSAMIVLNVGLAHVWRRVGVRLEQFLPGGQDGWPFPFQSAAVLHPWLAWAAATADVCTLAPLTGELAAVRLGVAIAGVLLARAYIATAAADATLAAALAVGVGYVDARGLTNAWRDWARDPWSFSHLRLLAGHVTARLVALGLALAAASRALAGDVLPPLASAASSAGAVLALPLSLLALDGTPRGTAWLAIGLAAPVLHLLVHRETHAALGGLLRRALPVQVGLLGVQAALALAGADPVGRLLMWPGLGAVALALAMACEVALARAPEGAGSRLERLVDRPALSFAVRAWELVAVASSLAPLALAAALASTRAGQPWLPPWGALAAAGLLQLALVRRAAGRVGAPSSEVVRETNREAVGLGTLAFASLVLAALQAVAQGAGLADVVALALRPWGPACAGAVLLGAAALLKSPPVRAALELPDALAAVLTRGYACAAGLAAAGTLAWVTSTDALALTGFLAALPVELGALALGGFPWLISPALLLAAASLHGSLRVVLAIALPGLAADPVRAFLVWPVAAAEALTLALVVRRTASFGIKRFDLDESLLVAWVALLEAVASGLATAALALAVLASCGGPSALAGARVAGPPAATLAVFLWLRGQSRWARCHAGVWAAALVLVGVVDVDGARVVGSAGWGLFTHVVFTPHGALILVGASLVMKLVEWLLPDAEAAAAVAPLTSWLPALTAVLCLTGAVEALLPGPDGSIRPEAPARLLLLAAVLTGQLLGRPTTSTPQPAAEGLALIYLLAAADGSLWRLLLRGPLLAGDKLLALATLQGALGLCLWGLSRRSGPWRHAFSRASLMRVGRFALHGAAAAAAIAPALPGSLQLVASRTALSALILAGNGLLLGAPVWGIGGVVLGVGALHLITWVLSVHTLGVRFALGPALEWPLWALLELLLAHVLLSLRPREGSAAARAFPRSALEHLSATLAFGSQVLGAAGLALALSRLGLRSATGPLVAWVAHALLVARSLAPVGGELLTVAAGTSLSVHLHMLLLPGGHMSIGAQVLHAVLHASVLSAIWGTAARALDSTTEAGAARIVVRQGAADLLAGFSSWLSLGLLLPLDPGGPGLTARLSVAAAVQIADLVRGRSERFDRAFWQHVSLVTLGGAVVFGFWGVTGHWFELGMGVVLVGLSRAYDRMSDAAEGTGLVSRIWSAIALDRAGFIAAQASLVAIGAVFLHYPTLNFDASAQVALATALAIALVRGHERVTVSWLSLVAVQATALHVVFVSLSELGLGGWPELALEPAAAAVLMLGHAVLMRLAHRAAADLAAAEAGAAPRRQPLPPAVLEVALPLWEMLVAVTLGFGAFGALAHLGESVLHSDVVLPAHLARLALLVAIARAMSLRQIDDPTLSGLPAAIWEHAGLFLGLVIWHAAPCLIWSPSLLASVLLTPMGALFELLTVVALDSGGPARALFARSALAVWRELWAIAAGVLSLCAAQTILTSAHLERSDVLVHGAAILGLRVLVPTIAQDFLLVCAAPFCWHALSAMNALLPANFWSPLITSPSPAAAALEVAALLFALAFGFNRVGTRPTALLPASAGGTWYAKAASGVMWLAPLLLVLPSWDAFVRLTRPECAVLALLALHLPSLWWMRRDAHSAAEAPGVLRTLWRRAAQLSMLAVTLPLLAEVVDFTCRLLGRSVNGIDLAIGAWGMALPLLGVLALARLPLPGPLHGLLHDPSSDPETCAFAPRLVDLFVDHALLALVTELGLTFAGVLALGSCIDALQWRLPAFLMAGALHLVLLLATRRTWWQISTPLLISAGTVRALFDLAGFDALFAWPLAAVTALVSAELVELAMLVQLAGRPLIGARTGFALAGAYRCASLALCIGLVPYSNAPYVQAWLLAAAVAAALSSRARTFHGASVDAATSVALVSLTLGRLAVEALLPPDRRLDPVSLLAWPALAVIGAALAEAFDAVAGALIRRAQPSADRPSLAFVWSGVLALAAQCARASAMILALGTLGVNLAAGPSRAGAVHLLALAIALAPVGRSAGAPAAEAATPAIASLAVYWFMLTGLTLRAFSQDPWYALARFEVATAALGGVWLAVGWVCERLPALPVLPVPAACRRAGDFALHGAAALALAAVPCGLLAVHGGIVDAHAQACQLASLLVSGIVLAYFRRTDNQNLASALALAHGTLTATLAVLATPALRDVLLDPRHPFAAALLLALAALYRRAPADWFGTAIPQLFATATRVLSRVAVLALVLLRLPHLNLIAALDVLGATLVLALGCARPDTEPTAGWARMAWPALLVLSSGQLLAIGLAHASGRGSLAEHLLVTPSLAALLLGWRVLFRRAGDARLPGWLARRVDGGQLGELARLADRALFPLALIPLLTVLDAGALTAFRLALSVLVQAVVFRERRSPHRRYALAAALGFTAVHVPLAVLGHHGGLTADALPQIAVSVLLGALSLEVARTLLEKIHERELADLVSLVALMSAGLALPAVGASLLNEADPAQTPGARLTWNAVSLALTSVYYMAQGARRQSEAFVYIGEIAGAALYAYLRVTGVLHRTQWTGLLAVGLNFAVYALARQAARMEAATFARPLRYSSYVLPLVVLAAELGTLRSHPWTGIQTLLAMGAFYTTAVLDGSWRNLQYVAALCYNAALFLAWSTVNPQGLQGYLTCVGVTVLWIVHANRDVFSAGLQSTLRTVATILLVIGPVGEWIQHTADPTRLMELAGTAALVGLAGVLMRIRVLLYTGTLTFGLALTGAVYHLSHVSLGVRTLVLLGAGGGVIALAALFEKQRDRILGRIKQIQGELARWD